MRFWKIIFGLAAAFNFLVGLPLLLAPRAFYAAAGLRTAALKGAITSAALRNLSRAPAGLTARPKCLGEALSTLADGIAPGHADVGIDRCQRELCGVYGCNLNQ